MEQPTEKNWSVCQVCGTNAFMADNLQVCEDCIRKNEYILTENQFGEVHPYKTLNEVLLDINELSPDDDGLVCIYRHGIEVLCEKVADIKRNDLFVFIINYQTGMLDIDPEQYDFVGSYFEDRVPMASQYIQSNCYLLNEFLSQDCFDMDKLYLFKKSDN
jgi:hypothetical protein